MSARLKPGESPREGLRRVVLGQINKALDDLSGPADPAETVHSARKRLKRLRALLRLARDGMDAGTFAREKGRLRDAGRPLAEARDATVLVAALDGLAGHSGDLGRGEAFGAAREVLLRRRSDAVRRVLGDGAALQTLTATLREARETLDGAFAGATWRALRAGLRRIDRNGRCAFRVASATVRVADLHEWRKRVKDLGYALDLIRPIRPSVIGQRANLAGELAEALGDDHDLAVLRETLLAGAGPAEAVVALLPVIDARRAAFQDAAFRLGRKVYRERPRDFADRVDRAWRAWRSRAAAR